jgi:hypothetical protein
MFREIELKEQAELLGNIVEKLSALTLKIREAFVHHQSSLFEAIEKQQLELNEEIAFLATKVDEQVVGLSLKEKEPAFRYEHILTHLQMTGKLLKQLAEVLVSQKRDGGLILDRDVDQIVMLLEHQEDVLRSIGGIVRSGDGERLRGLSDECRELALSCHKFKTSYESCLREGSCPSASAPLLLIILGRFQDIIRHELETLILLAKWNWDRVTGGLGEKRTG